MKCPTCDKTLRAGSRSCVCGWSEVDEKAPLYEICDYCRETFRWYRKSEHKASQRRVVGRSASGGYVCMACYQRRPQREMGWLDERIQKLRERDDDVGVMVRASEGHQTKAERHELIQWMKSTVKDFGKLPYDKDEKLAKAGIAEAKAKCGS